MQSKTSDASTAVGCRERTSAAEENDRIQPHSEVREIPNRWIKEQEHIRSKIVNVDSFPWTMNLAKVGPDRPALRLIAGVDISFVKGDQHDAVAAVVITSFPELEVVCQKSKRIRLKEPYISGFLAFREASFILELLSEIREQAPEFYPDIVMVDGNGILHPRGCGLACHLGVTIDVPSIGIGKNLHCVDGLTNESVRGQMSAVEAETGMDESRHFDLIGASGTVWGAAFCKAGVKKPIFVSTGHRISLSTAVALVDAVSRYRIPEPVRQADHLGRDLVRQLVDERKIG